MKFFRVGDEQFVLLMMMRGMTPGFQVSFGPQTADVPKATQSVGKDKKKVQSAIFSEGSFKMRHLTLILTCKVPTKIFQLCRKFF